jgi:hypothetical protein
MKTKRKRKQDEPEVAVKLIKQLDGLSIDDAKAALIRAAELLGITQVVSAKSRLL